MKKFGTLLLAASIAFSPTLSLAKKEDGNNYKKIAAAVTVGCLTVGGLAWCAKNTNMIPYLKGLGSDMLDTQDRYLRYTPLVQIIGQSYAAVCTIRMANLMYYVIKTIPTMDTSSNNKASNANNTETFKDIVGGHPVELDDIIDLASEDSHLAKFGATMPKGILLVGPPGTGKTSLARALANEMNAEFFYASGSEFLTKWQGSGAENIKALFKSARDSLQSSESKKFAIIFIDEIDALGTRTNTGANQESARTINQFLTEMDGFSKDDNILVIAATNRVDILDSALKRPGRFDYIINVPLPDYAKRHAILTHYIFDESLERTVDPKINIALLAEQTKNLSAADLKGIVKKAMMIAARKRRTMLTKNDVDNALKQHLEQDTSPPLQNNNEDVFFKSLQDLLGVKPQ